MVKFFKNNLKIFSLGLNIVGDGTPQAFIPFLTGKTEEELPLTRKRFSTADFVDNVYPFIWKNFSDAGYVTLYGEDVHSVGRVLLCAELIVKFFSLNYFFKKKCYIVL